MPGGPTKIMHEAGSKRGFLLFVALILAAGICFTVSVDPLPLTDAIAAENFEQQPGSVTAYDTYYRTKGVVSGPRPPALTRLHYAQPISSLLSENRVVVWILAQQVTYWGGFVLGGLLIVVFFEFISLNVCNQQTVDRYNSYAREVLKLVSMALVIAAIAGSLLFAGLIFFYSDLMSYLLVIFRPFLVAALMLLIFFPLALWFYGTTWTEMTETRLQWIHLTIGILGNILGTLLLLLINGWSTFMLSPAGVDDAGRFLGNYWQVLHTATWNAFNLHRILGNLVFASAVIAAYAAYRAMTASEARDKTYYDNMSVASLLIMTFSLMPLPFEGYWLSRELYAYRQQMGITMFGGLLAWLGIVLVSLVALIFLGINYYLWQRIDASHLGSSYRAQAKYVFGLLALCSAVYITPHTMIMTPSELLTLKGQQHQVLGNYGVESAKQPAINLTILVTAWSLLLWSRSRGTLNDRNHKIETTVGTLFLVAGANIVWLGIYGYYVPANVRVGLSVPMTMTTFTVVLAASVLSVRNLRRSAGHERVSDGLSTRGYYALYFLAFAVTWVMSLGGYRRSSLRLFWHVNDIMKDASPWAYTHSIGFATNVISLNALLFCLSFMLVLWAIRFRRDPSKTFAHSGIRT